MKQKNLLRLLAIFLAIHFVKFSFPQKEACIWYFGKTAGLDFRTGVPVPLLNGKLNTSEGCSTASDGSGDILFYTDGITVWNKNHLPMPNGTGLKGHVSTTQSALIVQKPGSANIYYIFTIGTIEPATLLGNRELNVNEVDMTLAGGLGDVSKKNTLLHSASCEKLTGVRHCNGKDIWIITHDWGTNAFRALLINSNGINPNHVISNSGLTANGSLGNSIGQLKGSPNGNKLASAIEGSTSRLELFDFDNSTGTVSNGILFPILSGGLYGVEFSHDGKKLYCGTSYPSNIFQFDLSSGSASQIFASGTIIGSSGCLFGSLQLGPDNKIYVARGGLTYLGVINEPELSGTMCNYVDEGVSLGKYSAYGLPNFVKSTAQALDVKFANGVGCKQNYFISPRTNGLKDVISVTWNFGDPASGSDNISTAKDPVHFFSKPGVYDVTLILHYLCNDDTLKQKVSIDTQVKSTVISGVDEICAGQSALLSVSLSGSCLWSTGDTTNSIRADMRTTNYNVIITTSAGCTYSASKTITVNPAPEIIASAVPVELFTANLTAKGASTYKWSPTQGLSCSDCYDPVAVYPVSTKYCVEGTDEKGCSNSACVDLIVSSAYIPNAFSPNEDNLNEVFIPVTTEVHDYHFWIFDKWGNKIFETSDQKVGWNGKYRDVMCDQNVYVYKVKFTDNEKNKHHEISGKVTLVR